MGRYRCQAKNTLGVYFVTLGVGAYQVTIIYGAPRYIDSLYNDTNAEARDVIGERNNTRQHSTTRENNLTSREHESRDND